MRKNPAFGPVGRYGAAGHDAAKLPRGSLFRILLHDRPGVRLSARSTAVVDDSPAAPNTRVPQAAVGVLQRADIGRTDNCMSLESFDDPGHRHDLRTPFACNWKTAGVLFRDHEQRRTPRSATPPTAAGFPCATKVPFGAAPVQGRRPRHRSASDGVSRRRASTRTYPRRKSTRTAGATRSR